MGKESNITAIDETELKYEKMNYDLVHNGKTIRLVEKGTAYPWEVSFLLKTTRDDQTRIAFDILESDGENPSKNERLHFVAGRIPKDKKGRLVRIKVTGEITTIPNKKEGGFKKVNMIGFAAMDPNDETIEFPLS